LILLTGRRGKGKRGGKGKGEGREKRGEGKGEGKGGEGRTTLHTPSQISGYATGFERLEKY